MSRRLDWPALLAAGLGRLRLAPAEFWALTPRELALMLGLPDRPAAPLGRARLLELMQAYPDRKATT
jgi:uncharacterized phage protein (TIGR02216 family)